MRRLLSHILLTITPWQLPRLVFSLRPDPKVVSYTRFDWRRALLPEKVITLSFVCLLNMLERGRELVHCLYEKTRICLPTSRRPGRPELDFSFIFNSSGVHDDQPCSSQNHQKYELRQDLGNSQPSSRAFRGELGLECQWGRIRYSVHIWHGSQLRESRKLLTMCQIRAANFDFENFSRSVLHFEKKEKRER